MSEEQQELELAAGDKKLKFRGSDLLGALAVAVGVLLLYGGWEHKVEAKDAMRETAQVLREANKEVAQTLKESNANTVRAIEQMAAEQRRANEALREMTCLLALPVDQRTNRAELCKRLSRDHREDRR